MARLRTERDGSKTLVDQSELGAERVYTLTPEGAVFLTELLRVGENDDVRPGDLRLMIERGWAILKVEPAPGRSAPPAPSSGDAGGEPSREGRSPLARRTRGREVALQVLYLLEQNPSVDRAEIDQFLERRLRDPKLIGFARGIVDGVREHQKHLDTLISEVAENWRIDRMAAIDRNILRVGAFEMLYCSDVPTKVAINEALELAKRYSTAQSSRFVNGILDRLQTAKREPEDAPAETPPSSDEE